MVADEPDFEKYPKTCAEFAGVVAKEITGRLLDGALWCYDLLRHVSVPDCVQRTVRGWEGRVWEVGDGEVDGPVAAGGVEAEREFFDDPSLEAFEAKLRAALLEDLPDSEYIVVRDSDGAIREVRPR